MTARALAILALLAACGRDVQPSPTTQPWRAWVCDPAGFDACTCDAFAKPGESSRELNRRLRALRRSGGRKLCLLPGGDYRMDRMIRMPRGMAIGGVASLGMPHLSGYQYGRGALPRGTVGIGGAMFAMKGRNSISYLTFVLDELSGPPTFAEWLADVLRDHCPGRDVEWNNGDVRCQRRIGI